MNAATQADKADPFRVVYWSAVYVERESQRLHAEYSRLLKNLQALSIIRWPKIRR